jgi:hypothetical protein
MGALGFPYVISFTNTLLPKELDFHALQKCEEEEEDIGGKVRGNGTLFMISPFTRISPYQMLIWTRALLILDNCPASHASNHTFSTPCEIKPSNSSSPPLV